MGNKIQRIYVGSNQVRPEGEYSYDFRDKSSTILTNDGWTVPSSYGATTTHAYTSGTRNNVLSNRVRRTITYNISNAKKITVEFNVYNISTSGGQVFMNIGDTQDNRGIGLYIGHGDGSSMYLAANLGGTAVTTNNITGVSGSSLVKCVVDLTNLTKNVIYNGVTLQTGSITQTQANNIKNRFTTMSRISGNSSSVGMQNIHLLVEY